MKKLLAALAILTLAGCASDYGKYAEIQLAHEAAQAERWKAMGRIAETGDTTVKVGAMFALQDNGQGSRQIAAPKSPVDTMMQALGIFVPALVQGYGIHANTQMGMRQSDNATALGISTNQAFVGMAGHIQAPAATINTTLSGTGTLGSGSYATDTHAITSSYNPAPVDNSNQGNPVTYPTTATAVP